MKIIEHIIIKFKKLCEGEYVPPAPDDLIGPIAICSSGYYKRPFIVVFLNRLWNFWKKEWKILLPIIIGAIVALFIHFDSESTITVEQEKIETVIERHIVDPPTINKE